MQILDKRFYGLAESGLFSVIQVSLSYHAILVCVKLDEMLVFPSLTCFVGCLSWNDRRGLASSISINSYCQPGGLLPDRFWDTNNQVETQREP